jgi:hypothetical protein
MVKQGDKVAWEYGGNTIKGTVEEKITSDTKIKGHVAKATKEEPQYVVKSEKTGKEAIHKPDALKKI